MPSTTDDFDDFVRTRSARLLRAAYLLTGDQHHAEDLVQSALLRTFRSWKRLHRDGNAEAYTRKVMYHLQVARWRRPRLREQPRAEIDDDGGEPGPADTVTRRLVVRQALDRLPPRQRAVIVLRFFERLSVAESATVLGCGEGTVKSQTAKALATLRKHDLDLLAPNERSRV